MTDYKTAVHGPVTVHEGDWYARRFPSGLFRTAYNDIATDVELAQVLASDYVCCKCADRLAEVQQTGPGLLDLLEEVPA